MHRLTPSLRGVARSCAELRGFTPNCPTPGPSARLRIVFLRNRSLAVWWRSPSAHFRARHFAVHFVVLSQCAFAQVCHPFPCLSLCFLVFPLFSLMFIDVLCFTLVFIVFPCLSLLFCVFTCLLLFSVVFLVFHCFSLLFLACPCFSVLVLVFLCLSLCFLCFLAFPCLSSLSVLGSEELGRQELY